MSWLSVDVETDLDLVLLRDRDVSFGRCDDEALARSRFSKLLRDVHHDGQDVAFKFHVHILHAILLRPVYHFGGEKAHTYA